MDKCKRDIAHCSHTTLIICRSYLQTSNISGNLVGNKIVDHSDVFGASSVGAAPYLWKTANQGLTLIFKVTCPFGQVRFEIHLSCMRCHLSTNPNPCRKMGIVQFCATIFDFSPVLSHKWHCKTTCPRSHFQHFYLSWTVGQPLRSSPANMSLRTCVVIKQMQSNPIQLHLHTWLNTWLLMDWAMTTSRWDEKYLSLGIWCGLY